MHSGSSANLCFSTFEACKFDDEIWIRERGSSLARAPLRWAGSKRRSISSLQPLLPQSYAKYIEPFAGSACLAFDLNPSRLALGDLNEKLIDFYIYLRDQPNDVYKTYSGLTVSEEAYYQVRAEYNQAQSCVERAGQFLYLNRHCFNGIYRVNRRGEFNVPWGGGKNRAKPLTLTELTSASDMLSEAELECADFQYFVNKHICKGALVYLDPPYASNETRVFREYHVDSFATIDWPRLVETLEFIHSAGAYFVLSYAGDKALLADMEKWKVGHLDVTRNIGGFRASRRRYREFIATNVNA